MEQQTTRQEWDRVFSRRLQRGECLHITAGPDGKPLVLNADDHDELHVEVVSPGLTRQRK